MSGGHGGEKGPWGEMVDYVYVVMSMFFLWFASLFEDGSGGHKQHAH